MISPGTALFCYLWDRDQLCRSLLRRASNLYFQTDSNHWGEIHIVAHTHTRETALRSWGWGFCTDQKEGERFWVHTNLTTSRHHTQAPVLTSLFSLSHEERRPKRWRCGLRIPSYFWICDSVLKNKTAQEDACLKTVLFILTQHCLYILIPSGPHIRRPNTSPNLTVQFIPNYFLSMKHQIF